MTEAEVQFKEFIKQLRLRLKEKNRRFEEHCGPYSKWLWNPDEATLTFRRPGQSDLQVDVTLVGTIVEESWEWSWANPNIPERLQGDIHLLRDYGQAQGIPQLTEPFLSCRAETGAEMTALAAEVLGALGSWHFPAGESYCYLVYRSIREVALSLDAYSQQSGNHPCSDHLDAMALPLPLPGI